MHNKDGFGTIQREDGIIVSIKISEEAARWYKEEMDLAEGDSLRFYVKIYGDNKIHPNFSLGISKEEPRQIGAKAVVEGILFYFDEQDAWFIDDCDLHVFMNNGEVDMKLKSHVEAF